MATPKVTITCERCGSSRFSQGDERYAVCMDCGIESQEMMNTTFGDWAEEQRTYMNAGSTRLLRRRLVGVGERSARGKKRGKPADATRQPPRTAAKTDALGRVARAIARALVDDCGVDGAAVPAVDAAWRAYAARVARAPAPEPAAAPAGPVKKKRRPSAHPEAARSRWRRAGGTGDSCAASEDDSDAPPPPPPGDSQDSDAPPPPPPPDDSDSDAPPPPPDGAFLDADARSALAIESVLPLVYAACRRGAIDLSPCDLSAWAAHGVIPYLTAWRDALDDATRDRLGPGGARHLSPPRAPTPGEIAIAAEARFAVYEADDDDPNAERWPPLDPGAAARNAARALVDGPALRERLGAQTARVLALAAAADGGARVTEPRALAALVVAATRYHPGRVAVAAAGAALVTGRRRWPLEDGAALAAGDAAAYAAFATGVLAPKGRPTGAAMTLDRLADALERRAAAAEGDAALEDAALDRVLAALADDDDAPRPLAPPAALVEAYGPNVAAAAADLERLCAARLVCPPDTVAAAVAAVRDAVDAAVYADDRADDDHADRLDADAEERCNTGTIETPPRQPPPP